MLLIIAGSFLFVSCEKVIDINLNNAEKKYVIEAVLTDQPGSGRVLLSQTKDFDEDNTFAGISGATVIIAEVGGATTTLTEVSPGTYRSASLTGVSGRTYELTVSINGSVFTARSTMPQKINLDTIYVTTEYLFGEGRKVVNVEHGDIPGLGNSFRYVQYINGAKLNQLQIRNDDYSDGRYINSKLFYFDEDEENIKIRTGDLVQVDLQCIDPVIYRYWFSLIRSSTGGSGQATPANPVTNITGGALGYFSAHTLQSKTMIVP